MQKKITVIILTKNEENHIERAIKSVSAIAAQVVIIDSFSTDRTIEIANNLGALVYQNKFVNYAQQFQWALDNISIDTPWVMRLDADEYIDTDLSENIQKIIPTLDSGIAGINIKRKHIFMDRWIRYGGRYPLLLLRIWRNGQGRIEDRWMDEHMVVWGGRTIVVDGGFSDHNLNDLTFFTDKHNKYATREAIDILNQRLELFHRDLSVNSESTSLQTSLKRIIKERIYNKTPFTLSASLYFFWRYIFQLGFLDGRSGLVYHFLQGYWYRFLVGAKVMELEKAIAHLNDKQEIIEELSRLTGHKLN